MATSKGSKRTLFFSAAFTISYLKLEVKLSQNKMYFPGLCFIFSIKTLRNQISNVPESNNPELAQRWYLVIPPAPSPGTNFQLCTQPLAADVLPLDYHTTLQKMMFCGIFHIFLLSFFPSFQPPNYN